MEPRLARLISRRQAIPLIVFGLAGAACSTAPVAPTTTETKPSKTPQKSSGAQETKSTGDGLTPEERTIRLEGYNFWKNVMSQKIQYTEQSTVPAGITTATTFSTEILNPNVWTPERFQQLISTDDQHPITVPLKVGWNASSISNWPEYHQQGGEKWYGEVEFNNIRMITKGSAPAPYSAASTYLKWAGIIQFNFIEKGHSIYENTGTSWVKDANAFQAWVNRPKRPYKTSLDSLKPIDSGFGTLVSLDNKGTHFEPPAFSGGSDLPTVVKRFFPLSEFVRNGCQPGVNCELY